MSVFHTISTILLKIYHSDLQRAHKLYKKSTAKTAHDTPDDDAEIHLHKYLLCAGVSSAQVM